MLTVAQVSEMLNIKASTIYSWASLGKIPCIKIHGCIRFCPDEIHQWIESLKRMQVSKHPIFINNYKDDTSLERLIAGVKLEVYNSCPRGNQTKIEPQTEGGNYGAL